MTHYQFLTRFYKECGLRYNNTFWQRFQGNKPEIINQYSTFTILNMINNYCGWSATVEGKSYWARFHALIHLEYWKHHDNIDNFNLSIFKDVFKTRCKPTAGFFDTLWHKEQEGFKVFDEQDRELLNQIIELENHLNSLP